MATFVVCTRCGRVQEISGIDQMPDQWRRSPDDLLCPRCCSDKPDGGDMNEVLEEEVIYPSHHSDTIDETFDEDPCEVCRGPCQGH